MIPWGGRQAPLFLVQARRPDGRISVLRGQCSVQMLALLPQDAALWYVELYLARALMRQGLRPHAYSVVARI